MSTLTVLKPGDVTRRVPYGCALNSAKEPVALVTVRTVLPFEANSTDACSIAAPVESETVPEILVRGSCAATLCTTAIQHKAKMLCRILIHHTTGPVLFLTWEMNDLLDRLRFSLQRAMIIPATGFHWTTRT